jgi:hypothetical protein
LCISLGLTTEPILLVAHLDEEPWRCHASIRRHLLAKIKIIRAPPAVAAPLQVLVRFFCLDHQIPDQPFGLIRRSRITTSEPG